MQGQDIQLSQIAPAGPCQAAVGEVRGELRRGFHQGAKEVLANVVLHYCGLIKQAQAGSGIRSAGRCKPSARRLGISVDVRANA